MKVLVTGGAGYIGSTICSCLLDSGHTPVILDNLSTGCLPFTKNRVFYQGDIADSSLLKRIFSDHPEIECTIHCAARIIVPESVKDPELYYQENVIKSMQLFKTLISLKKANIVFSSSASIYGREPSFKVTENSPLNPQSPYAKTKLMMEWILEDFCKAYGMNAIALRYFNPIGAEPQFRSGPFVANPTHLLGVLLSVAHQQREFFPMTGTQWPTRDGTGIRDYIHIADLAMAHVRAVERFFEVTKERNKNFEIINLGSGNGVTVKEFVKAFEKSSGKQIAVKEMPPREGDVAGSFADATKADTLLHWQTQYSVEEGIKHALEWTTHHQQKVISQSY